MGADAWQPLVGTVCVVPPAGLGQKKQTRVPGDSFDSTSGDSPMSQRETGSLGHASPLLAEAKASRMALTVRGQIGSVDDVPAVQVLPKSAAHASAQLAPRSPSTHLTVIPR